MEQSRSSQDGDHSTVIKNYLKAILAFGPRAVGSAAEKATAEFIAGAFGRAGLTVTRQDFLTSYAPLLVLSKIIPLISIGILAIAAWVFFPHPAIAAILLILLLVQVPLISLLGFSARFPKGPATVPSANIIAETRPTRDENPTVILVAHYDSKSQTLSFAGRVTCVILPILLCLLLALLAVLLAAGAASPPAWAVRTTAGLAVLCLILQITSRTANRSPGAIDNASGVAVLLALAERLGSRFAGRINLLFMASGAEELGLVGAREFIQSCAQRYDPARTLVFNFDSLGAGSNVLLVGKRQLAHSPLLHRVRVILGSHGLPCRFWAWMVGAAMDHIPFTRAGFIALSFTQTTLRAARTMHSSGDTLEQIDISRLAAITGAVEELLAQLDPGQLGMMLDSRKAAP